MQALTTAPRPLPTGELLSTELELAAIFALSVALSARLTALMPEARLRPVLIVLDCIRLHLIASIIMPEARLRPVLIALDCI